MDERRFDALTTLVADGGSRRAFARLLAGGLLGGLAAMAAHAADETAAKPKPGKHPAKRPKPAHRRHANRHPAGQPAKPPHPPHPSHPSHPSPTPDPPCPDGEGQCRDGSCVPFDQCCDDDPDPLCSPCEEIACTHGTKVCRSTCQYADSICCGGQCLLPCSNGQPIDPTTCQCSGSCPSGSVSCPLVSSLITGLPDGCCQADRVYPDVWYGTSNLYCRPPGDPSSYWCTMDGLPGV